MNKKHRKGPIHKVLSDPRYRPRVVKDKKKEAARKSSRLFKSRYARP